MRYCPIMVIPSPFLSAFIYSYTSPCINKFYYLNCSTDKRQLLSGSLRQRRLVIGECISRFVGGLFEEVMLQCVIGRYAGLRVVVQHAYDDVLELKIISDRMSSLRQSTSAWTTRLNTEDV